MAPVRQRTAVKERPRFSRWLIVFFAIAVVTVSLATRTVDVHIFRQTSVTSSVQKAKTQHRDQDGAQWLPPVVIIEPFYLALSSRVIEPEDDPPVVARVDDCLYNRPPPRS